MGMYTELCLNMALNYNTPESALTVLRGMISGADADKIPKDREHDLFRTDRWNWMLQSSSHYFVPKAHAGLITFDYCPSKHLSLRCDLKNYSGEIDAFVDWLAPIAQDGFGGYKRYEESNNPTLIYFQGGKAVEQETTFAQERY